jgi:hypothetical protein
MPFKRLVAFLGPGDGLNPNRLSDYDNDNETTNATIVCLFKLFLTCY